MMSINATFSENHMVAATMYIVGVSGWDPIGWMPVNVHIGAIGVLIGKLSSDRQAYILKSLIKSKMYPKCTQI